MQSKSALGEKEKRGDGTVLLDVSGFRASVQSREDSGFCFLSTFSVAGGLGATGCTNTVGNFPALKKR